MNLANILTVLQSEPLLCGNDYRARLLQMFEAHAKLSKSEFQTREAGKDICGQEIEVPQMTIEGSLAIIPIGGPIGCNLGKFEKGAGCVDVADIRAEIVACETNNDVENIILNFDSPGGMVTGTPELAAYIRTVQKPIYAYTGGTMASGAFYHGCSCDGVFASPTARVGNIGVYQTFLDLSRMAEMQGIAVKVFSSGTIKGYGEDGTSLTAEQQMFLQARVMEAAKQFFTHVRETRSQISAADMQGQWYWGTEAVSRGFIDDIMPTLADLKAFLS